MIEKFENTKIKKQKKNPFSQFCVCVCVCVCIYIYFNVIYIYYIKPQ